MIRRKNIKYELCDDAMPRLIAMCIFLQNNFDQNSTCTLFLRDVCLLYFRNYIYEERKEAKDRSKIYFSTVLEKVICPLPYNYITLLLAVCSERNVALH